MKGMPVEIMHITLAGSKFSSGTLPTMHSIYVYSDICICIYLLNAALHLPLSSVLGGKRFFRCC